MILIDYWKIVKKKNEIMDKIRKKDSIQKTE
jgi:hypothetical protein